MLMAQHDLRKSTKLTENSGREFQWQNRSEHSKEPGSNK